MKAKCLSPQRYLVVASLVLISVLLTFYSSIADAQRREKLEPTGAVGDEPAEHDGDPEYIEKRGQFLNRFFGTGPGGVSPRAYERGRAMARVLPPSPLLRNESFRSLDTPKVSQSWTLPIAPPIEHSYGGNAGAMVHALAIDPFNASIVYTGSFGGLAKTTDAGFTWQYLSDAWTSQSVSAIAVDPNASRIVYAGTGREDYGPYGVGLYRSFDGGLTWSRPLGNDHFAGTYVRTIAIDSNASGSELSTTLYVANTSGLWRSTDSGTTFTQKRPGGIYDVAIDASTLPSTLYVTDEGGTFKSTDSGNSWINIHHVLLHSHNRLSVVRSTSYRRRSALYLLGPGAPEHNLFKSTDRGVTWIQIPTRCFAGADSCDHADGNIGFKVFAVDPANPRIILGGNLALYRTTDEGTTWMEIGHWYGDIDPRRSIHTDQQVIAFSSTVSGVVYGGNDGGVVSSANYGLDWTNLNQNLPGALMYSVALSADGSMMAGTQDNGAVFSHAGDHWDALSGGDSGHALLDLSDSTWAYYVIYDRNSFTRVNTQTHESTNIAPAELQGDDDCAFFPPFSMNPSSPKHLLASCQHVVRTLDATASPVVWTTIGGPLAEDGGKHVIAATEAPSNPDVIYAVTNEDAVFVTSNASEGDRATWIQVTQTGYLQDIHAVSVHPTDPRTAYLACNSGVYKTTDMGATWLEEGVQDLIYRDVAIDPTNPENIFAACNAGVFASTDGGLTWGNLSDGIPTGMAVTALSFNAMNRQLAAATFGRGVYMLNVGQPEHPHPGQSLTRHPRP
ncbi:MAG TPA: hypothetical protein VGQ43_12490 [Candidatus Udaeobacter sp.]|nr:hypothetical protein [Candidatus Udaeobacter sp.]